MLCTRTRAHRGATMATTAALVAAMAAGCTHSTNGSAHPRQPIGTSSNTMSVNASTTTSIAVAGSASSRLSLRIRPGDFAGRGYVAITASTAPSPALRWFIPDGPAKVVGITGTLARPLTLTMATSPAHSGDLATVLRHDAKLGWYPVAVGDPGRTATAQRSMFSPHLPGWSTVTGWLSDRISAIKRWATGRTTPPNCSSAAPAWASLTTASLDVLLSCVQTNSANGTTRVELQLKNNRGLVQEITVPPGVAYAAVEDQPDPVRSLVRTLAGGRDV
jgi:hypothetical protein